LALVGVVLGLAFLTKMLAGLLVLPGFAIAYLIFAPTDLRKRLGHLAIAGATLVASAGWWVVVVELWPASARPYISNSTDNSVLNLALGYNGLNRILGRSIESAGDVPSLHHNSFGSQAGPVRLFTGEVGFEISWALPAAIFLVGFAIYLWVRSALSQDEKAALIIWTSWVVVSGVVFTCMDGMMHAYYTVALAPAIGALVGLGAVWAWRRGGRDGIGALTVTLALAAGWSVWLLHRADLGPGWLRWAIAGTGVVAVGLLVTSQRAAAVLGLLAVFAGVTTFGAASAATPHEGSTPVAVRVAGGWPALGSRFAEPEFRMPSLESNQPLANALRASHTRWSAAASGSQSAAALEIGSGTSVMAIGGWNKDPVPTLGDFIDAVRAGWVGYYVVSGRRSAAPAARDIDAWVEKHFQPEQIGGTKVYRLT
jgi:4-amino-4-deoxy-L-arabinose transferase-like glycosyltransferase